MLGVRSVSGLAFYDWESTDLVRRIEISPKNVSSFYAQLLLLFNIQVEKKSDINLFAT